MPGRVSVKGKPRKPKLFKNTSETFTFKAAVLAHYDKATLSAVIQTFWPGIELRSKTYNTKKRVILRWKENRLHIKTMADNTRTAHMKRFRNHGAAKTLPDEAELDILEWLLALRSHGVPISAQMLAIEAREVAKMYDIPPTAFAHS
ncbi:hypothetical protein DVH05_016338 [Phytophthora capsici]|nr:hypothetical protein DVH05_008383 [Phytophthora capsici]KAG1692443.1 hypothetical protein DVH05_025408 [Phytophthora capsici]KAG1696779.1 hypothetical protein DVH05_018000 [Phytophthora capsici]KAG1697466.1 hypothetical protein DVH05_016338 [Phytophthora capsici]|eukprot:jgi/Phyca11/114618/e_gw1.26.450.1